MWRILKINFFVMAGSLIFILFGYWIISLLTQDKKEPNELIMFVLLGTMMLAVFGFGVGVFGICSDCWRLIMKGEEIEGYKYTRQRKLEKPEIKSQPVPKVTTTTPKVIAPVKSETDPNDPLGIL